MTQEKTREELFKEINKIHLDLEKQVRECHFLALKAARMYEQLGQEHGARICYIRAAENVTGYLDQIDADKASLYERGGELAMAIIYYEKARSHCRGGWDLHGDPKPGEFEDEMYRETIKELKEKIAKEERRKSSPVKNAFFELWATITGK